MTLPAKGTTKKPKRFRLFTSFDVYLICAELKQLQKLKAVREPLGRLIRLPSPAACPYTNSAFFRPFVGAISK